MTIDEIQRRDQAFDVTSFLARAEAVHSLVQRARSEGRPGLARPGVSDDMAARLTAELDHQRLAGETEVIDLRIASSSIVDASADPNHDTIAVRFQLDGRSYTAVGGKPVGDRGDRHRTWAEDWWFQRPAGATTAAATSVDLEHCLGCGAPANPTAEGRCAYCNRPLADPRTWVVVRTADAVVRPDADAYGMIRASQPSAARRLIGVAVLVALVGGIGLFVAKQVKETTSNVSTAVKEATAAIDPVRRLTTTSTGYVTAVGNPKVRAPVNDLAGAAAALKAAMGRPVLLTGIHLYEDGRINFEAQAPDDPASSDTWTWKAGKLGAPSQGSSRITADRFFALEGVNLGNLEQLCGVALGKTGIIDGVIVHPYLVNLGKNDLRWYIPVQSESRSGNSKTYRVGLDGKHEDTF